MFLPVASTIYSREKLVEKGVRSTDGNYLHVTSAKGAKRSKGIHLVTMFAQHAGLRHKEIRTLQWNRLNLIKRIITVGETKSDAGTGRTIPVNDELFSDVVEYVKWYTERLGTSRPD